MPPECCCPTHRLGCHVGPRQSAHSPGEVKEVPQATAKRCSHTSWCCGAGRCEATATHLQGQGRVRVTVARRRGEEEEEEEEARGARALTAGLPPTSLRSCKRQRLLLVQRVLPKSIGTSEGLGSLGVLLTTERGQVILDMGMWFSGGAREMQFWLGLVV